VESLPLLGVIGAFWASSSTFLNLHQELNRTRDAVLGYPPPPRSADHRRLLLFHDWIPLWRFTVMLSTAVGIASIVLAGRLGANYGGAICVLFGLVTLSIAISWFVHGKRDLRAMTEVLAQTASMASTPVEMDGQ
jgi:hypothetical protein